MAGETSAFAPSYIKSFQAQVGTLVASVTVAGVDTATASARLPGGNTIGFNQLQICNLSTSWTYVNFGRFGAVVAATVASSYPVAPGSVVVVTVDSEVDGASVIHGTAAATGNVIFTRGFGL